MKAQKRSRVLVGVALAGLMLGAGSVLGSCKSDTGDRVTNAKEHNGCNGPNGCGGQEAKKKEANGCNGSNGCSGTHGQKN